MKMAYALGAALLGAAGLGYAEHVRKPAAEPDTKVRIPLAMAMSRTTADSTRLPAGHPMMRSSSTQPFNSHIERDDPGIPQALLDNPGGVMPLGHPSVGQQRGVPRVDGAEPMPPGHPNTVTSSETIAVPKLARASGSNGYVIADIFSSESRLAGKRVRVRGMVTKVTPDVLGQTFLHLRDGSGDSSTKTNDLAVMTKARTTLGDVVVFDGTLRMDADLGIGYRYPALLENAALVNE